MNAPLLSAVIPTWNRAHVVCDAIESALAQREGRVEVIVVDDGSTDGTRELLAGRDVVYLSHPSRRGVSAARNTGIRAATGELVSFLDSDDVWLPGKLDAELRVLERFPEAEAVVSDGLAFFDGRPDVKSRFGHGGLLAATHGEVRWVNDCRWLWTNSTNGVQTSSITVRREALLELGDTPFAEDLDSCEDWEFQMRLYHHCRVVVLPEVFTSIRRFSDGTRPGRAIPGTTPDRQQEIGLLRNRLTVMERSQWLQGLEPSLAAELQRFHDETARRLGAMEGS